MSYKSRQKKRAINATKHKYREVMAGRWYLTIVRTKTCCARCSGILKEGAEMVYRHTPRESLCRMCADDDPNVKVRVSTSWEKANRRASSKASWECATCGGPHPRRDCPLRASASA